MGARAPAPAPVADGTEAMLREGTAAPDVAAPGVDGKPVRLSSFHGKVLVLYFYPVDFASGAMALAEELRDDYPKYRKLGATVIGVSTDAPGTHRDFAARYRVPFPLLSDGGGQMAQAFGVPLEAGAARHATFVIDRNGVIRKAWRKVRPWGHSAEVLAFLKTLR
jgi:peroxiredoxin Q/BCP